MAEWGIRLKATATTIKTFRFILREKLLHK